MERNGLTEAQAEEQRRKYVEAWNTTMIDIWKEQITLLGVIDTGRLLRSPIALPVRADGRFFEIQLSQEVLEYGIWQDYGTGRETPRKGRADESRYRDTDGTLKTAKVREARKWFSKKYYSSVMAIKDFIAESVGEEFIGVMSDVFDDRAMRSRLRNT